MKVEFKQRQQFKIKSEDELKRAYEALKDEWNKVLSLDDELRYFKERGMNFVSYEEQGITIDYYFRNFETIKSPFRKKKSLGKKIKHKNINHEDVGRIGFVDNVGDKGYFVFVGDNVNFSFHMVAALCGVNHIPNTSYGNFNESKFNQIPKDTYKEVIPKIQQYYIFKNRKQLYKWLSK